MVKPINIHEAKTHLSKLLQRVEAGEEIVIARNGTSVARLTAIGQSTDAPRRPGGGKGLFQPKKNFDDPLPDRLLKGFYENPLEPSD